MAIDLASKPEWAEDVLVNRTHVDFSFYHRLLILFGYKPVISTYTALEKAPIRHQTETIIGYSDPMWIMKIQTKFRKPKYHQTVINTFKDGKIRTGKIE